MKRFITFGVQNILNLSGFYVIFFFRITLRDEMTYGNFRFPKKETNRLAPIVSTLDEE